MRNNKTKNDYNNLKIARHILLQQQGCQDLTGKTKIREKYFCKQNIKK